MFTLAVFETLLPKFRLVLTPAQRGTGSEIIKVLSEIPKKIRNLLKLYEN